MSFSRTILLTGFPGFIAGRLVERLAREEYQFFLLVQSEFLADAVEDEEQIGGSFLLFLNPSRSRC